MFNLHQKYSIKTFNLIENGCIKCLHIRFGDVRIPHRQDSFLVFCRFHDNDTVDINLTTRVMRNKDIGDVKLPQVLADSVLELVPRHLRPRPIRRRR